MELLTLTALRYRVKLSQNKLAQLSKIAQPVVSNYERGLIIPADHAETLLAILRERDTHNAFIPPWVTPSDLERPWSSVFSRGRTYGTHR